MEPEHHHKILIIVIALVAIVVLALGVMAIIGRKSQPPVSENNAPMSQYEMYIKATSADKNLSITDPQVVEFNKATSATAKAKLSGDRDAYIKATSVAESAI